MKYLIFIITLILPNFCRAQALIGFTLSEIEGKFPEKVFKVGYTDDGHRYATADMEYGTFGYYFDDETNRPKFCIQTPYNIGALNAQVEVYNKRYVIISDTCWKAYLEGGKIIKIEIYYDEEQNLMYFTYE